MLHVPGFWIGGEVAQHVFVDERLQIEPERVASGADNNIGADASGARNISAWIGNAGVMRIVAGCDTNLFLCCIGKFDAVGVSWRTCEYASAGGGSGDRADEKVSAKHIYLLR